MSITGKRNNPLTISQEKNPNRQNKNIVCLSPISVFIYIYLYLNHIGGTTKFSPRNEYIKNSDKKTQTILSIHNIITQIENMLQLSARFHDSNLFILMPTCSSK